MTALTNPNLFVITGGPGSGKTALLRELEKNGFRCAPEVARQIIQEQVRSCGNAVPWANRERYTELMLKRSIQSYEEHSPSGRATFSDRGIPDTLGYARLIGLPDVRSILTACNQYRYASLVFLAPAWKEIYETDDERKQRFDEAERTCELVSQVYRDCGYHLLELPKVPSKDRADFVLSRLHLQT
jgi:predicted ATPase